MSTDLEDRLRSHLQVVAASTAIPPVPDPAVGKARRPVRRRRRVVIGAAVAVLLPLTGLGIAAAVDNLTAGQSLFYTGPTGDGLTPDLTDVQQILTSPGPAGERFVLYAAATTHGGGKCVAFGFFRGTTLVQRNGDACFSGQPWWWPFGNDGRAFGGGGSGSDGDGTYSFAYTAGTATRAVVRYPDGHTTPVAVAHGWLGGWLPAGTHGPLEVLGYDPAGHLVGHLSLYLGPTDSLDPAGPPAGGS